MILVEYLRFLQTLNTTTVPTNVRKLANLVLENLDNLIPLSTHQGQRVKRIVALAQTNWNSLNTEIPPLPEQVTKKTSPITQMVTMEVGPFRGFARQEIFDLASSVVLIYGPNGTGKSSFCEALEYSLLGNVAEAESKRFRDQRDYLKNAHVNSFIAPVIVGIDEQRNKIAIEANEALYRFCFVERNRIDSFSRIAAQAPSKQTELISTLFGLDSFNEFVRNFTTDVDSRYIDLTGVKAAELVQKSQILTGARQQIETKDEKFQKLDIEEQTLANQYREGSTFSQMAFELNGDEQHIGSIQLLETELQRPQANKSNLTIVALQMLGNSIRKSISELISKRQELISASRQVSFKNLYESVSQLQPSSLDHCPACKTPLNQVSINPYAHASAELQKLQYLAELQEIEEQHQKNTISYLLDLSKIINTCLRFFPQNNVLQNCQMPSSAQVNIEWWNFLHQNLSDGLTPWQHIQTQINQLEEADKAIDRAASAHEAKQTELNRLREFKEQITILKARRHTIQETINSAQQTIINFDRENAQLIADVEAEKTVVETNQAIAASYSSFVEKLNDYKDKLPEQLVSDLGEIIVTLYNAFNRNDSSNELLTTVKLPLTQNQRLEISFQNNPEQFHDALHILSEGHIRCIGLAVLLAKNLKENCPLLIFDDPVNAIDDDHRESIRVTLFEDKYFSEKQIILTCHGEEFFKDIQNLLSAKSAAQARSFTFLPRLDDTHIRVDFNCSPRNYIIAARGHFGRNEIREALSKSRQALEFLAKVKVWRYVSKHGDGNLSLKLRSPTAPLELRNLTEQLKRQIGRNEFSDQNKNSVQNPINTLLGFDGNSREWRYLNKGTHEENDRAEFDRHTVSIMISALEELDQALQ